MVFPSIPAYPDPSNWQQHQPSSNQHQSGGFSPQLLQPPPQAAAGGGGMDWVRPGSLVERARLANIPMPQVPLKCPRCDSTNTKFCYFNNYSLSQPRHFCKTCRRYWTRGGALRRVPVGGGCRRNKRSRAAAAKSALFATTISSTTEPASNLLGLPPQFQQLRFTAPLSQTADYSSGGHDMGFNFTGMVAAGPDLNTPAGTNFLGELATLLPNGGGSGFEPWRLQPPQPNFPFLGGFDQPPPPPPAGVFLFQSGVEFPGYAGEQSSPGRPKHLSQTLTATVSSVKVEDSSHQEPNMGMQLMGIPGSDQWSSIAWTDLSNFTSSSTTNPV